MRTTLASILLAASIPVFAQLGVVDPWVRATVPGQGATGAFMQLRSKQDVRVVAARSAVAGVVELHEMKMEGGVMKMKPIKELAVPGGAAVDLKPGGYHVMLMDLKKQVKEGDEIPITLVVEAADGKRTEVAVTARARPVAADGHAH